MADSNIYRYGHGIDSSQFDSGHTTRPAQLALPYEDLVILLLICGAFGILAAISRFIGFLTSRHIVFSRRKENSQNADANLSGENNIVNNKDDEDSGSYNCHEIPAKHQGQEELTVERSPGSSDEFSVSPRKILTCEFWVASGLLLFVVLTAVFRKTVFVQGSGSKPIAKAAAMALGVVSGTDVLLIGWCLVVEGVRGKIVR